MFTQMKIVSDSNRMPILKFNWIIEKEEHLVIRNKLTKKEYFDEVCSYSMQQNGIALINYNIPRKVPLEAVSRIDGKKDVLCKISKCPAYGIYWWFTRQKDGRELFNVEIPDIMEDMEAYLPDQLIYFNLLIPGEPNVKLFVPRLHSGVNQYEFVSPGPNCTVDFASPKLNENADYGDMLEGTFKLIKGYPDLN